MAKQHRKINIAVAWNCLPLYGAIVLSKARKKCSYNFPVIYTPPRVPVEGLEQVLENNLFKVNASQAITWKQLGIEIPKIFIHSGWRYKHFNSLASEVRKNGGYVIGMFDNNLKFGLRQSMGILFFRIFLKYRFNGAFVPGIEGSILAKYLGFKDEDIYQGLYSGDSSIFKKTTKIINRPKNFIFVGQFIHRKGLNELIDAFEKFSKVNKDWTLKLVGQGNLLNKLESKKRITIEPFMPPNYISRSFNNSRILILPSYEEHWGVVVHEATLCGCGLLLSSKVGSAVDLASEENSIIIQNNSVDLIFRAMKKFAKMSDSEFNQMENKSIELSQKFNTDKWINTLMSIINKYQ